MEQLSSTYRSEHSVLIENLKLESKIVTPLKASDKNEITTIMHDHSYNELFICLNDVIQIKTEDEIIALNPGDIAVLPPTLQHRLQKHSENSINFCVIGFTFTERSVKHGFDLYELFHRVFHKRSVIVLRNASALSGRIYKVAEEIASHKQCTPVLELSAILSEIAEISEVKTEEKSELFSPSPEIERLENLEQMINTRYMMDITSKTIAEELFISERQLSRIINKRYNSTLKEVIVANRIKTAEQLLLSSDISISEICFMVGFKDLKTFHREFKKKHSLSPSEYRKNKSDG